MAFISLAFRATRSEKLQLLHDCRGNPFLYPIDLAHSRSVKFGRKMCRQVVEFGHHLPQNELQHAFRFQAVDQVFGLPRCPLLDFDCPHLVDATAICALA